MKKKCAVDDDDASCESGAQKFPARASATRGNQAQPAPATVEPRELSHCRVLTGASWLMWSFPAESCASGWAK